jgi:hypothetical protein
VKDLATRKQIGQMGLIEEREPGVIEVITITGRRLRWLRIFGSKLYKLADEAEAA